jgi:hypothetical protein
MRKLRVEDHILVQRVVLQHRSLLRARPFRDLGSSMRRTVVVVAHTRDPLVKEALDQLDGRNVPLLSLSLQLDQATPKLSGR